MVRSALLFLAALVVALLLLAAPSRSDDDDDAPDRIRSLVQSGEALALPAILEIVAREVSGEVIEIDLDKDDDYGDDRLIYELEVLAENGRVLELEVDAITGEILEIEED